VGYDIHLLRFVDGEPQPRRAGRLHDLLSGAARSAPDEHGYARLSWRDGEADVYGVPASPDELIDGVMFSRPAESDRIFDLIYEVAHVGEMAVLLQEGEVCLVDPAQREHLPPDVQGWPRHIINSGQSLAAVVKGR
jgi:hypothetical protein